MRDWTGVPDYPMRGIAVEEIELMPGEKVAWVETDYGKTDGMSRVHRARTNETSMCGEHIPTTIRRLPLLRSLQPCGRCEFAWSVHMRGERESEAESSHKMTT